MLITYPDSNNLSTYAARSSQSDPFWLFSLDGPAVWRLHRLKSRPYRRQLGEMHYPRVHDLEHPAKAQPPIGGNALPKGPQHLLARAGAPPIGEIAPLEPRHAADTPTVSS